MKRLLQIRQDDFLQQGETEGRGMDPSTGTYTIFVQEKAIEMAAKSTIEYNPFIFSQTRFSFLISLKDNSFPAKRQHWEKSRL
ncbi:MAG: hypothetical protein J6T35_03915, partial [Bacteroidales bacterium]|nr:hypothetical protein [Bacteroidales bacterium]